MSSDLVQRLRNESGGWASDYALEAADRIEALEGEVARLTSTAEARLATLEHVEQQFLAARVEMRAAEARAERLRVALVTLSTETNISQEERKFHARKALEDDKK